MIRPVSSILGRALRIFYWVCFFFWWVDCLCKADFWDLWSSSGKFLVPGLLFALSTVSFLCIFKEGLCPHFIIACSIAGLFHLFD